jgi:hypothetical protein
MQGLHAGILYPWFQVWKKALDAPHDAGVARFTGPCELWDSKGLSFCGAIGA